MRKEGTRARWHGRVMLADEEVATCGFRGESGWHTGAREQENKQWHERGTGSKRKKKSLRICPIN